MRCTSMSGFVENFLSYRVCCCEEIPLKTENTLRAELKKTLAQMSVQQYNWGRGLASRDMMAISNHKTGQPVINKAILMHRLCTESEHYIIFSFFHCLTNLLLFSFLCHKSVCRRKVEQSQYHFCCPHFPSMTSSLSSSVHSSLSLFSLALPSPSCPQHLSILSHSLDLVFL